MNLPRRGLCPSDDAVGIEYYIIANNMGYDGDLELTLIPESFRTDALKEEADTNEVLVEIITGFGQKNRVSR